MNSAPRRPNLVQEDDRLAGRWAYGLALFAVLAVAGAIVWGVHLVEPFREDISTFTAEQTPPRTERIRDTRAVGTIEMTNILADSSTRTLRKLRRERLDGYGWVNPEAGLVSIPIRRAMELVAASTGEGEPAVDTAAGADAAPPDTAAEAGAAEAGAAEAGDSNAAGPEDGGSA